MYMYNKTVKNTIYIAKLKSSFLPIMNGKTARNEAQFVQKSASQ